MLRTDSGVVQTSGDGVHRRNLTVFVLAEQGLHSVEYAKSTRCDGCRGFSGVNAAAGSLAAYQADVLVVDEVVEHTHRIGAAAHACHNSSWESALLPEDLLPCLLGDHALEVTNDHRERMRTHY